MFGNSLHTNITNISANVSIKLMCQ